MARYLITEKAGRRVAGRPNTGVGTALDMTEAEAKAAVEAGELVAPGTAAPKARPASKAKTTPAAKKTGA